MLSEAQIRRVWEGMLASEIRAKYFTELSGSYLKRQRLVTWGILLFSSADAVSFLKNLPDSLVWIRAGLAVCAAGASIYLALAQYERSVIEASDLYMRWNRLQRAYRAIWENTESPDALSQLEALGEQESEASRLATSLANNAKSMLKWQTHTEREYKERLTA